MAQKLWRPIRRIVDAVRARREDERARREAEWIRREDERARRKAERARRRKLRQHWSTLSGVEFEREMGPCSATLGTQWNRLPVRGTKGLISS